MTDTTANLDTEAGDDIPPGPAVTRDLFLKWRSPRFGTANPERMSNPVWEWLVKARINAYQATQRLGGPSAMDAGPGWCFHRFGQSTTELPDGRVVFIAGEHEDHYDPDFYIYNDVVIQYPDGRIEIFGYPREVFPPTDFHSATLAGHRIILIGSLGYPEDRRPGTTQVLALDLDTLAISAVATSGTPPGWIHRHQTTLSEDGRSILVQGGKVERAGEDRPLVENLDDWRLHLDDWHWERLTDRQWPRWEVRRQDRRPHHLFDYQRAVWEKAAAASGRLPATAISQIEEFVTAMKQRLGHPPDVDLFARLYTPPVTHESLPETAEEFRVRRIKLQGVVVRYVDAFYCVQVTVEGDLPPETSEALTADLLEKFSALENVPCERVRL